MSREGVGVASRSLTPEGCVLALNSSAQRPVDSLIDISGRDLVFRDLRSQSRFHKILAEALLPGRPTRSIGGADRRPESGVGDVPRLSGCATSP
jgi:hypothetical protein